MNNPQSAESRSPEETLALAASIARRNVQEMRWTQAIMAEVMPAQEQTPVEALESLQTGLTVVKLRDLEDPDRPFDLEEIMSSLIDDTALTHIAQSNNRTIDDNSREMIHSLVMSQAKALKENFSPQSESREDFKDLLSKAGELAVQQSVEVNEVFDNETLYGELMRRRNTPQTYVDRAFLANQKLNKEFLEKALAQMAESLLQTMHAQGQIDEEEMAEMRTEMLEELYGDPDTQAFVLNAIELTIIGQKRIIARTLERYWGTNALNEIDSRSRAQIIEARGASAPLHQDFRDAQRRNDIVKVLCQQHGWNPNTLTVDQLSIINASEEMVSLHEDIYRRDNEDGLSD